MNKLNEVNDGSYSREGDDEVMEVNTSYRLTFGHYPWESEPSYVTLSWNHSGDTYHYCIWEERHPELYRFFKKQHMRIFNNASRKQK